MKLLTFPIKLLFRLVILPIKLVLATAGAVNLMLVTFLVPVSAIILGALFLDERLTASEFLGMALIGLGLAAIDGRLLAWLRRSVPGRQPGAS